MVTLAEDNAPKEPIKLITSGANVTFWITGGSI